jgi:hypothetical protein
MNSIIKRYIYKSGLDIVAPLKCGTRWLEGLDVENRISTFSFTIADLQKHIHSGTTFIWRPVKEHMVSALKTELVTCPEKTLFDDRLEKVNVLINDTDPNSTYFKVTELNDTFTGGKNAFLIQRSEYLVAHTLIKIQIKDANGDIIYHEPGEGIVSASVGGEPIVTEYYEGTSKVVAVYIYPNKTIDANGLPLDGTAFGPATITILGELKEYESNGLRLPVPDDWKDTYNVKWTRTVNVNPSLANVTKIRFYKRPTATIKELLQPLYSIDGGTGLKVDSGISQSFAQINLSNLETFAGDVRRVKVYRTSQGDISDYDLIQDVLLESKELLTTFG